MGNGETTSVVRVSVPMETVSVLQQCADEAQALVGVEAMERTFVTAAIMKRIREELAKPGVMTAIASLQNSAVGFMTDRPNSKNPAPYTEKDLVDPTAEALIRGFLPINNEYNVISRRFYAAKTGLGRKLKEFPGLVNLKIIPGIPHIATEKAAVVKVKITATYKGNEISEELEFSIRVNEGMGADAVTGKAIRKSRAWLFGYLTDTEIPEGDIEEIRVAGALNVTPGSAGESSSVADRLRGQTAPVETPQASETAPEIKDEKSKDWSNASPDEVILEVDRLITDSGLTKAQADLWATKRHGSKIDALQVATLRPMCVPPYRWLAEVLGMVNRASAKRG